MPNYNPDSLQTRQPSGKFGSKKTGMENRDDAQDAAAQTPMEPKIRDLFIRRIFETDAIHLPYVTRAVMADVNERYRCVSQVFYGTENHWPEVRKRIAKCLRDGKRDGLPLAVGFGDDCADQIEHSIESGGHQMSDDEFRLLAHEYQCNAVLMEIDLHTNGQYYVTKVAKYARSAPSEGTRIGFIDYDYPTIVCVKRGARCEVVRELTAETGELFIAEKRRYEVRKLKEQVAGRKIPALFIEGMNARGITGGNVKNGWAVLKTEYEEDHFTGRMLPTAEARVELLDYCVQEVLLEEGRLSRRFCHVSGVENNPTLIEDECPVEAAPADAKGGDTAEPAIPGFTPVLKKSADYVDEEPEGDEEAGVETEPLYTEQPGDVPETRRRTVKCPYPSLALQNRGSDCFLNATVQLLRFAPLAKQRISNYNGNNDLTKALKSLLENEGRTGSVDVARLRSLLSNPRADMREGHQDPTEFLESYLFRDANPGSRTPEQQPLSELFAFTANNELTCLSEACPRRVTRGPSETECQLNVPVDHYKQEQDFPSLIARLQAPETVVRKCGACGCPKARMRRLYDFSRTAYLQLRFLIFDNRLNKRHVDFSGHQLNEMNMFGQRWNALSLLIHRGERMSKGHYWTECRASGGDWRKFEDDYKPTPLYPNVILKGVYCVLYERLVPPAASSGRVATPPQPARAVPPVGPKAATPHGTTVKTNAQEKMDTSSPSRKPPTSELSSSFIKRAGSITLSDVAATELSSSKRMKKTDGTLPPATVQKLRRLTTGSPTDMITTIGGAKLTRGDFTRLITGGWFTDNIIDAYFYLLKKKYSTTAFKLDALSSHLFDRIERKGTDDAEVKKWLRAVDVSVDLLLLPIHTTDHYSLMYVAPKVEKIFFGDSHAGAPGDKQYETWRNAIFEKTTAFLGAKWNAKTIKCCRGRRAINVLACSLQFPQQTNGSDCGAVVCVAARFICARQKIAFGPSDIEHHRWKIACELLEGSLLE